MLKNKTQLKFVRKSFFAILYGLMSAIGINVFLSHAHSYSIGVPGIAQLLQAIFANFGISVSISFLMIIMNIPLFLFALKAFGFNYIVFSLMAVASNIFFLQIIPQVTVVTNDLTNTLVGAAIIGAGIGFCFNNGFSTGGTDVIVTYFQNKYKMKIGFINNLLNGVILILTAIFFNLGRSVYSLLGMLVTSWMMDFTFKKQKDTSIMIFTKASDKVADALRHFVHGATLLNGTGIYTGERTDIIIIVAQQDQIPYLRQTIKKADPNAFISIQDANAELGNYTQVFDD
jgi:yitT family protein